MRAACAPTPDFLPHTPTARTPHQPFSARSRAHVLGRTCDDIPRARAPGAHALHAEARESDFFILIATPRPPPQAPRCCPCRGWRASAGVGGLTHAVRGDAVRIADGACRSAGSRAAREGALRRAQRYLDPHIARNWVRIKNRLSPMQDSESASKTTSKKDLLQQYICTRCDPR